MIYKTAQLAKIIGVHPNTVRLYEEWSFISKPERKPNGYRVFTDLHLTQFRLARLALEYEIVQNGLRKKSLEIITAFAAGKSDEAERLTEDYLRQIDAERNSAEEAVEAVLRILSGEEREPKGMCLTRQQTADYLRITVDSLRNWELNGLLTIKRRKNGYRVYTDADIDRLKIIRALRSANYSLAAILRMLTGLNKNPQANIRKIIDTPEDVDEIISVCDALLTSLNRAEANARKMLLIIKNMNKPST